MHVTKRVPLDWLIDWLVGDWLVLVGWLVGFGWWVGGWVSEHRRTTSHHSVISAKIINFICSVALKLCNKRMCAPLCVLDHPWRVFFLHASWALTQQNSRVSWYYLVGCLQCQNGNPSCKFSAQGAICHNKLANFYWKNVVWVSIRHGV